MPSIKTKSPEIPKVEKKKQVTISDPPVLKVAVTPPIQPEVKVEEIKEEEKIPSNEKIDTKAQT